MPGGCGGQEEEIEEVDTAWYRTEPDFNEYPVYGVPYAADGLHGQELYDEQQAELVEMEVTERQQEAYQPTDTDVVEYARFLGIEVHACPQTPSNAAHHTSSSPLFATRRTPRVPAEHPLQHDPAHMTGGGARGLRGGG